MPEEVTRGKGRPAIGSRRISITITEAAHAQLENLALSTGNNITAVAREVLNLGLAANNMKEGSRG